MTFQQQVAQIRKMVNSKLQNMTTKQGKGATNVYVEVARKDFARFTAKEVATLEKMGFSVCGNSATIGQEGRKSLLKVA